MCELEYTIPNDISLSHVSGKLAPRVLWQVGLKRAMPAHPRKYKTDLDGLPIGDPEAPRAKKPRSKPTARPSSCQGRGRGSSAHGPGQRRGKLALALEDADPMDVARAGSDAEDYAEGNEPGHQAGLAGGPLGEDAASVGEFIGHIAGDVEERGDRQSDPAFREAIAANLGAFSEMYLASLEGEPEDSELSRSATSGGLAVDMGNSPEFQGDAERAIATAAEMFADEPSLGPSSSASDGHSGPSASVGGEALLGPTSSSSASSSSASAVLGAASGASHSSEVVLDHGQSAGSASSSALLAPPCPQPEPQPELATIEVEDPFKGGLVTKGGRIVGRITPWPNGKNFGVKCMVHPGKCSHVVSAKVAVQAMAEWLAAGVPAPPFATTAEVAELRRLHMEVPRPSRRS